MLDAVDSTPVHSPLNTLKPSKDLDLGTTRLYPLSFAVAHVRLNPGSPPRQGDQRLGRRWCIIILGVC
eukprot:24866-Eustigmatos_ZCMA.PRE.1